MNLFLVSLLLFTNYSGNVNPELMYFFDDFLSSFNNYLENHNISTFKTKDIEYKRIIQDSENNQYLYLDFKGNNGFILIKNDNRIVLFDADVDLPSLRENNDVWFSDCNFVTSDGVLEWRINNQTNRSSSRTFSPGFIAALYPNIIEYNDIPTLLSTKYSLTSNWFLYDSGRLDGLSSGMDSDGYCEFDDSVYVYYDSVNNVYYSEGNCGIISTANAISYYSKYNSSCSSMPSYSSSTNVTPSIDEPAVLADYSLHNYYPKSSTVTIHTISNDVRLNAISAGYTCYGGMNDYATGESFVNTLNDYGYLGSFTTSIGENGNNNSSFSLYNIKAEINDSKPMQFRMADDVCYGGHGVMVTGYRHYKAEDIIYFGPNHDFGYPIEYNLLFLSIYDGWSQNERWYDLTTFSSLGSDYCRASAQSLAFYHIEEDE